jgi:hypothetical protein
VAPASVHHVPHRSRPLLAIALAVAGCGGEVSPPTEVCGIAFYDRTDGGASFLADSGDLLAATAEAAAGYWGDSTDALRARGIYVVVREWDACGIPAAGGCFTGDHVEITMHVMGYRAREVKDVGGALLHEIGHAVLYATTADWDARHLDPRWAGLDAVYRALYETR